MDDKIIEKFTASIEKKIGSENYAKMADDIGEIITQNANTQKQLSEQAAEIAQLKKNNETLVAANGNLLKQVPVQSNPNQGDMDEDGKAKSEPIDFRDAFDKDGNFIK